MREYRTAKPVVISLALLLACPLAASAETLTKQVERPLPVSVAGLQLPEGFTASLVANNIGPARHIVVRENGDIYVNLREDSGRGSLVALRDTDGDVLANEVRYFAEAIEGTGIDIHQNYLYASSDTKLYRFALSDKELLPQAEPELVITGFPVQGSHASKSFAFDASNHVYVNVGAPSNACQERTRSAGSMGVRPCLQLEQGGGIWKFSATQLEQQWNVDGKRFATGLRNSVALAWDNGTQHLYAVPHGRDQLNTLWPDFYDAEDNAELPAEEFHRIDEGGHYGWPYTYYDPQQNARMMAPEYGGNGKQKADGNYIDPLVALPAHWAPNDLVFYHGEQFPEEYRGGAFIAFHGSWNRAPESQDGFNIVFIPFKNGKPDQGWQIFADGFAGRENISRAGQAAFRPTGLAVGADGALYVSDSVQGRIWRIAYQH